MSWVVLLRKTIRAYEKTQVELQGQYSVERFRDLNAYCAKTSNLQVFWVLASMPLPCLADITLIELIRMQDPAKGLSRSALFFVRSAIVAFTITVTILDQCRRFVPSFKMKVPTMVVMALITTCATAGCEAGLAHAIAYPLPFTVITSVPARFGTIGTLFALWYGKILWREQKAREELFVCLSGLAVQVSLIIIYPLYNFAFQNLQSTGQTGFTLLLPLIKVFAKNWIAYAYREMEGVKPEMVIFNSEIFHALYVSACMQSSRSGYTTMLLMGMDFVQFLASMPDVLGMLRTITALRKCLGSELPGYMLAQVGSRLTVEPALFVLDHDTEIQRHPSIVGIARKIEVAVQRNGALQLKSSVTGGKSSKTASASSRALSVPTASVGSPSVSDIAAARNASGKKPLPRELYRPQTLKVQVSSTHEVSLAGEHDSQSLPDQAMIEKVKYVLHVTEFLLLIEFIEALIPVIYCGYIIAAYNLPNRDFYILFKDIDEHEIRANISNVVLYAFLEFASFILLAVVLRRKIQMSMFHQLAFAMGSQWGRVQAKILVWVLFTIQLPLEHFGENYRHTAISTCQAFDIHERLIGVRSFNSCLLQARIRNSSLRG